MEFGEWEYYRHFLHICSRYNLHLPANLHEHRVHITSSYRGGTDWDRNFTWSRGTGDTDRLFCSIHRAICSPVAPSNEGCDTLYFSSNMDVGGFNSRVPGGGDYEI